MKEILNIPIEPLEERYSIQWAKWFEEAFKSASLNYRTIPGLSTSGKITNGSFLDVVETNAYKNAQLSQILDYLKSYKDEEGVILFFHDLWFPGIETIAYIRDGMGWKNLKICGCLHAGSYDEQDFLYKRGMEPWAYLCEEAWLGHIVDKIFVATYYHKRLLTSRRRIPWDKIVVTGFPLYPDFVEKTNIPPVNREPIIVFPHRLDEEKDPNAFDKIALQMPEYQWIKSKEVCSTKKEYYNLLQSAKIAISFAKQETWGIAMQEAVLCGAIPLCPNRLSYTEMYNDVFLYDTEEGIREHIHRFMNAPPTHSLITQQKKIMEKGASAIPNIIIEMHEL